jgi:hypothetical protein
MPALGNASFEKRPDTVVDNRVDHHVDARGGSSIDHAVRQMNIYVVTPALVERELLSGNVKLHPGIRSNRYMDAHLTVFKTKSFVAVFPDKRARRQAEQTYRFQLQRQGCEYLAKKETAFQQRSIPELGSNGCACKQIAFRTCEGSQRHALPFTAEIALVVVRRPLVGANEGKIVFEPRGIEVKRQSESGEVRENQGNTPWKTAPDPRRLCETQAVHTAGWRPDSRS